MSKIIDKILSEVSLDHRVSDGMFTIENNSHMEALRDYLTKKGIDEDTVKSFSNTILEKKGKHPEKQAFNTKGLLITFPSPEYKAAAIKRGTHFEENPLMNPANSNLFTNQPPQQQASNGANQQQPAASPAPETEPKTSLPVSQAMPQSTTTTATDDSSKASGNDQQQKNIAPKTTAAPQQTSVSTAVSTNEPSPDNNDDDKNGPEPIEKEPPKSPEEKEAEKNVIKNMLKGDDYMLERIKKMVGVSNYMLERIIEHALKDENLHYDIIAELQCRNEDGKLITEKKL